MSKRLIELTERKERLISLAASQRSELSRNLSPLKAGCIMADKGVMVVRYLQQHPIQVAGGMGLIIVLKPRKSLNWLKRGWFAWRMVLKLRQRLDGFLQD